MGTSLVVSTLLGLLALGCGVEARAQCCAASVGAETSWAFRVAGGHSTSIHADDQGGVYLLWDGPTVQRSAISRDEGETWEPLRDDLLAPGELLTASGPGTVIRASFDGGFAWVQASQDQARSFAPAVSVLNLGAEASDSLLGMRLESHRDGLVILLATVRHVAPLPVVETHAVVSGDHGRTWSAGTLLHSASSGLPPERWGVALSATTALVVWPGSDGVWSRRSGDAGRTWAPTSRVDAGSQPIAGDQVHAGTTQDGVFQVAFDTIGAISYEHRVSVSTDEGATWPGLESVVAEGNLGPFSLQALESGTVVVGGWFELAANPQLEAIGSTDRGMPGTWPPGSSVFPGGGFRVHDVRVASALSQVVMIYDDYRDDLPTCPDPDDECESIYLSRTCDGGSTWEEFRIDDDTPPRPVHSEEPKIAFASNGRLHVAWSEGLSEPDTYHRAVDFPEPPQLELGLRDVAADPCAAPGQQLEVVFLTTCPAATFEWFEDGSPIPGATGDTYLIPDSVSPGPHAYRVIASCNGDPVCSGSSPDRLVEVGAAPTRPVVLVSELPATPCLPAHHRLEVDPAVLAGCGSPSIAWFIDDVRVSGAAAASLVVSVASVAPGPHSVRYEVTCSPPQCASSEPVFIEVHPDTGARPESVGGALRVMDHGDPVAASISASLGWLADDGAPRPANEHYHVLRGTDPAALTLPPGSHPVDFTSFTDATPAGPALPWVHYYKVLAADDCERLSAD